MAAKKAKSASKAAGRPDQRQKDIRMLVRKAEGEIRALTKLNLIGKINPVQLQAVLGELKCQLRQIEAKAVAPPPFGK